MKRMLHRRTETAFLALVAALAGALVAPAVAAENAGVGVVAGYSPSAGRFTFSRPPPTSRWRFALGLSWCRAIGLSCLPGRR